MGLFVLCLLFCYRDVFAEDIGNGSITGIISAGADRSMSGGTVNFFEATLPSPFTGEFWRNPDYSEVLPEDGSFTLELPAGTYYLMAVKNLARHKSGPPEAGDLVYPARDDKVPRTYSVLAGKTTDIGVLSEAVPFKQEWLVKGKTGIEGVVLDWNGKPYQGVLVLASEDAAMKRPLFVSDGRTGSDGKYILRVPQGGRYYIRVKGQKDIILPVTVIEGALTKGVAIDLLRTPGAEFRQEPHRKFDTGPCRAQDFETRVTGVSECLVMKRYGYTGPLAPEAMLVWLHGDLSRGGNADYHFPIAEKAAIQFEKDKVLSIALVRPGYPIEGGAASSGNNNGRIDSYTRENIEEVGAAIERLRARYKPKKVILVGDSGGAAIAAVLLGMKPELAEGAVLSSCPCDRVRWREGRPPWTNSEDPSQWTDRVRPAARVIALTGSRDNNTYSDLALHYINLLKERGIVAEFQLVRGAGHTGVIRSEALSDAVQRLIREKVHH